MNGLFLTDPKSASRALILNRRVPPARQMDHMELLAKLPERVSFMPARGRCGSGGRRRESRDAE
jgi:hypothetical protein